MNEKKELSDPKKRRLERERLQRRNAIIRTAERFFISYGFDQTMVEQIASEAGYSKATIYNYFDSKDDLFLAVVARVFKTLFEILNEYMYRPNVEFDLRNLGDGYYQFVEQHTDSAALFNSARLGVVIGNIIDKEESNQTLSESEQEFRKIQLQIQKLMTTAILNTIEQSQIKTKIDPMTIVMILSTLNSAIINLVIMGKGNNKPKEFLDVFFNILDSGLKYYNK